MGLLISSDLEKFQIPSLQESLNVEAVLVQENQVHSGVGGVSGLGQG